jgi:hypothetical protein
MFWTQNTTRSLNYNITVLEQRNGSSLLYVLCISNRAVHIPDSPSPQVSQTHACTVTVCIQFPPLLPAQTHTHTHAPQQHSLQLPYHTHTHTPLCTISCALTKLHFTLHIRLPREKDSSTLNISSDSECTCNMVPPRLRCPMVILLLTDTSFKLNGKRGGTRRINGRGVAG